MTDTTKTDRRQQDRRTSARYNPDSAADALDSLANDLDGEPEPHTIIFLQNQMRNLAESLRTR